MIQTTEINIDCNPKSKFTHENSKTTKKEHLKAEEWQYLSEGNLHIVFRYKGSDPKFIGKVLKMEKNVEHSEKEVNDEAKDKHANEMISWLTTLINERQLEDLQAIYLNQANDQLIEFLPQKAEIEVENAYEFINEINVKTYNIRPENRRHKKISQTSPFNLLFDFSFCLQNAINNDNESQNHEIETIFVEIKPKSYLFDKYTVKEVQQIIEFYKDYSPVRKNSLVGDHQKIYQDHFYDSNNHKPYPEKDIKYTKFYKMQLKKNIHLEKKEHSLYSPLYFYANEPAKIKQCLHDLKKIPQNNFRLFINGQNALAKNLNEIIKAVYDRQNESEYYDNLFDILAHIITESQLIEVIKAFQNLYDHNIRHVDDNTTKLKDIINQVRQQKKYTVEQLSNMINEVCLKVFKEIAESFNGKSSQKDKSNIKDLSLDSHVITREINNISNVDNNLIHDLNESDDNDTLFIKSIYKHLDIILRFLLSITFRDCSILINFHKVPKESLQNHKIKAYFDKNQFRYTDIQDNKDTKHIVAYKIGLVDIEIKPLKSLITYPKLDTELLKLYVNYIIESHICNNEDIN